LAPVVRWVVFQAATWAVHPVDKWAAWLARVDRSVAPAGKWAAWLAQVDKSVVPVDPWAAWVAPAVRWVPWVHPAPWVDQAAIKWVFPALALGKWEQVWLAFNLAPADR
jgi:hypothetical protein